MLKVKGKSEEVQPIQDLAQNRLDRNAKQNSCS